MISPRVAGMARSDLGGPDGTERTGRRSLGGTPATVSAKFTRDDLMVPKLSFPQEK